MRAVVRKMYLLLQQARQIIELKDEIIANKEQVITALRHEIEWLNEKIARLQLCDRPKSSLHSDIFLKDNVYYDDDGGLSDLPDTGGMVQ